MNDFKSSRMIKDYCKKLKTSGKCSSKRLLFYKNDVLYLWNGFEKCVDSTSLQDDDCVCLVPSPPPYFDVEGLSVNQTSTYLSLYGSDGLCVCKLSDRWLAKEGKPEIPTDFLAKKAFVCDHRKLRCVKWHPGSPSDSHLLLLTSDEVLRLYDVSNLHLVWECRLTDHQIRRNLPSKISLGETPVDFDFCPSEIHGSSTSWPLLVLWGNGDVYMINAGVERSGSIKPVEGPLRFEPSAEDNYGTDATSIIVLECSPPFVVISTSSGRLHHSVLYTDRESEERSLLVTETMEIDSGFSIISEREDDIITRHIRLEKDPDEVSRYFCFHSGGIHSIYLPIINKLSRLCEGELDNIDAGSNSDYLLCTGLSTEEESCATVGHAFLESGRLLVLLSNGEAVALCLLRKSSSPWTLSNDSAVQPVDAVQDSTVEAMLRESGVCILPVLKIPGKDLPMKERYELVVKSTGLLRSVLKCHSDTALKLRQRTEITKGRLEKQSAELETLAGARTSLRSTAEQIAERYEEIYDKQNDLIRRTERILLRIECNKDRAPGHNEKRMSEIFKKAKDRLATLENDIAAVKAFHSRLEVRESTNEKQLYSDTKVQMLHKNLKHLNDEINDLVNRVMKSKELIAMCS